MHVAQVPVATSIPGSTWISHVLTEVLGRCNRQGSEFDLLLAANAAIKAGLSSEHQCRCDTHLCRSAVDVLLERISGKLVDDKQPYLDAHIFRVKVGDANDLGNQVSR